MQKRLEKKHDIVARRFIVWCAVHNLISLSFPVISRRTVMIILGILDDAGARQRHKRRLKRRVYRSKVKYKPFSGRDIGVCN